MKKRCIRRRENHKPVYIKKKGETNKKKTKQMKNGKEISSELGTGKMLEIQLSHISTLTSQAELLKIKTLMINVILQNN